MINELFVEIREKKIYFIFFSIFQIGSYFLWYENFGGYLFNIYLIFILIVFNKKISNHIALIVLIFIVIYATLSFLYKNPNKLYAENKSTGEGVFIIEDTTNKGMMRGALAVYGQNPLEDSNYNGFIVYDKHLKIYVVMSCSLLQASCEFNKNYSDYVYIKYIKNQSSFWYKNAYYVFHIKYKSKNINDFYFSERYKRERLIKLYFIIFYLLINFIFIFKYKVNKLI